MTNKPIQTVQWVFWSGDERVILLPNEELEIAEAVRSGKSLEEAIKSHPVIGAVSKIILGAMPNSVARCAEAELRRRPTKRVNITPNLYYRTSGDPPPPGVGEYPTLLGDALSWCSSPYPRFDGSSIPYIVAGIALGVLLLSMRKR
ncbi:MAG: hypothetical protein V2G41_09900 [bacterium JZ-2024 1]